MKLRIVEASERLQKTAFQADEDWAIYPRARYTCPDCSEQVEFALRDLDKHWHLGHSNLSEQDSHAIESNSAHFSGDANSYLDFYCPGCSQPVRIYYEAWIGGRWTHGHNLLFVVEGVA